MIRFKLKHNDVPSILHMIIKIKGIAVKKRRIRHDE